MVSKRWKNTGLIPRSRSPVRSGSSSKRGSLQSLGCSCGDRDRDVMRKARLLCPRRNSWRSRSRLGLCSYRELFVLHTMIQTLTATGRSLDDYISMPPCQPHLLRIRRQPLSQILSIIKKSRLINRWYSCLCCADTRMRQYNPR